MSELTDLERALVESDILAEMIRRESPEESGTKHPSRFLRLNDAEVQHRTARARVIAERAKAGTG